MDALIKSVPSLWQASSLTVRGPVRFEAGVVVKGDVTLINSEQARGAGALGAAGHGVWPCPVAPACAHPVT